MARPMESSPKRPRISIDVTPELRRRLRLAAASHDLTIRQYVLEAIQERLREDLPLEESAMSALTAKTTTAVRNVRRRRPSIQAAVVLDPSSTRRRASVRMPKSGPIRRTIGR